MSEPLKKCLIIYNPVSGRGITDDVLNAYKEILRDHGYEAFVSPTRYSNHATLMVEAATYYDIVFSIGGDGTLNEVINGNYLRKDRLTICPLPSGTCNDVATMLGYGKDPIANLTLALDGEVNDIDIGTINDKPFVYVVGMGKFMNIPYDTKSEDKRKIGYIAYLKESINELFSEMKNYKIEIVVDGVKLNGNYSLVMISNANHIAGINNFYKDVCLNDGKMEILLCKSKNMHELLMSFMMFFMGQKTNDIISLRGREVLLKLLDEPLHKWCVDGEEYDYDGEDYRIKIDDKMKFLTPKSRTRKLFKL